MGTDVMADETTEPDEATPETSAPAPVLGLVPGMIIGALLCIPGLRSTPTSGVNQAMLISAAAFLAGAGLIFWRRTRRLGLGLMIGSPPGLMIIVGALAIGILALCSMAGVDVPFNFGF